MKKYFKIGEISKLYGIGVDAIRYYEKIGIIQPERATSGYRHYSIHDIWRLNVIRDLRSLGMTMEQIREYLDHHTVASSIHMLDYEQQAIDQQMEKLNKLKKDVARRLETIQSALSISFDEIQLLSIPPRHCHHLPEGYKCDDEMDFLIKQLINLNHTQLSIIGNNQIGTILSRTALEKHSCLSYQSVFVIDEDGSDRIEGGHYLSVTYRGNYKQSATWGKQLLQYAKDHHFQIQGDLLELLWIDIHTTSDENEFITELQLPVALPKETEPSKNYENHDHRLSRWFSLTL